MKRKKTLIFLMTLVLLIQPAAAMATELETESASEEQTELETESVSEEQTELETESASEEQTELETESVSEEQTELETESVSEEQTELETESVSEEQTEMETVDGQDGKREGNAVNNEVVETESKESRIVLELPLLEDYSTSPFDFIMDPQELITATNAARYGGARFERGATLYFKNTKGEYEYSHKSDYLEIISRSNVPVCVTVELAVKETYGVNMVQSTSFSDDENCSMYLALVDSNGNETAVGTEGTAAFQMVLPACEDEDDVSVCSFALIGCCNPDGDWSCMTGGPQIVVNWTLEPLASGEDGV